MWTYWRPGIEGISELGASRGGSPSALATHFHAEAQLTLVLAGRRAFRLAGRRIELGAGQCSFIPAGVPHQSEAGSCDLVSFNAYLPAGDYAVSAMIADVEQAWRGRRAFDEREFAAIIQRHRRVAEGRSPEILHEKCEPSDPIGLRASRSGTSRETYSRAFAKRHGMPPHAFEIASRLNKARDMLRTGEGIAAVAAETGFADQSHLGRLFRRAFGITPGRYRIG